MKLNILVTVTDTDTLTGVPQNMTLAATLTAEELLAALQDKYNNNFLTVREIITAEFIDDPIEPMTQDELEYYDYSEALKED